MEKLLKTIESLKVPAFTLGTESNVPGSITCAVVAASDATKTKKNERISHCLTVTDAILNPSTQNLMEFPKILKSVTEVLFQLCNDTDSDIRLVAVDCLNRIVRTLRGILLNKFQLEVFHEIKKCQSPRSLRAALSVFATLSADIRPNRCRGFIQSLLPTLVQISKRTEELLYENLATSFLHILQNLGLYLTDNEVKVLCQQYLTNLESKSIVVRRSSATVLVYICQFSRKPNLFLPRLLIEVIELLTPNVMEKSVSTLIGVLLCVRQCIPPLYTELETSFPGILDEEQLFQKIVQVYEICLILCNHDDHNVITTSLETLQQVLSSPVFEVSRRLTSPGGIQNSFASELWLRSNRSEAPMLRPQSYWPDEFTDADTFSAALPASDEFDLQTFRSEFSSTTSETKEDIEISDIHSGALSRRDSEVFIMATTSEAGSRLGSENSFDLDLKSEDEVDCCRISTAAEFESFPELHIGSLYDANVPLHYCTRFLAYNFLLSGSRGHQRSDKEIRVAVKALAINCLINSVRLCPIVYFLPLCPSEVTEQQEGDEQQTVSDVELYCKHHDPLLRGSTYLLISYFVSGILRNNHGVWGYKQGQMENILSILNAGLLDKSNIGVKYALSGLNECLVPLLRSRIASGSIGSIFQNLFLIASNPYWLVKVNLAELLGSIQYDSVPSYEDIQDRVLNLFLLLISDEDVRVRSSSVSALIKFIRACERREDWIMGRINPFSTKTVLAATKCDICRLPGKPPDNHSNVSKYLDKVLNRIVPELSRLPEKHFIASYYFTLSSLAEVFPPSVYHGAWRCRGEGNELPFLFTVTVEFLRSSSIVSDIYVHQNLLCLVSRLLLGLIHRNVGTDSHETGEKPPFFVSHKMVTFYGLYILNHCFGVMKLYNNLLKSLQEPVVPKKQSPLSPGKKLLVKEKDAEKKGPTMGATTESEKKSKQLQRQQSNPSLSATISQVQLKRIEDSIRQSWNIYKSNLDPVVTQKFSLILVASTEVLGSIFACIRNDFVGLPVVIEDILTIAPVIFTLAPVPTLRCMKKILRCLNPYTPPALADIEDDRTLKDSLTEFETWCENFYKNLPACRRPGLVQISQEKSSLGIYIRSFEPIVITALKTYLSSSNSSTQAEILLFLSELIKGQVNYAMVDSNQVFLTAVIKQLTFLEEGQFRESAVVVDAIFDYFTHLSHADRMSRKFVDTPKLLQLCDGLVASGQNPATNYIPAMNKIVYDLFIRPESIGMTNLEKKEIEAQREVLFQNSLKLLHVPDVLPMLFLLIHGRRVLSEAKWSTESGIVAKALLDTLQSNHLIMNSSDHFHYLAAVLFSVDPITLPPFDQLKGTVEKLLDMDVSSPSSLLHWMTTINTFWLVIFRTADCNADVIPTKLLLDTFLKLVQSVLAWAGGNAVLKQAQFIEQVVIFIKMSCSLLAKECSAEAIKEFTDSENREKLNKLASLLAEMSLFHPELRKGFCEFLTALACPYPLVWDTILSTLQLLSEKDLFVSEIVPALIKQSVLPGTDPPLQQWLVENYSMSVIQQSNSAEAASLWAHLSTTSQKVLIQKLIDISDDSGLDVCQLKSILSTIEVVFEKYKTLSAMLCIKMLEKKTLDSIVFEISQFACFLFVKLHGQQESIEDNDRLTIKEFAENSEAILRFPRLVSLTNIFLSCGSEITSDEETGELKLLDVKEFKEDPIFSWCCEEISASEGIALAQILSTMKYTQVLSVLQQPNFNLAILKYVFQHLHMQVLQGLAPLEDLVTLLTMPNHSTLLEKLPLGVAALDYIIEMLDTWETLIPENGLASFDTDVMPNTVDVSFRNKFCEMWILLKEILRIKDKVLDNTTSSEKSVHNNYIPTKVFTFSFQYMRALCNSKPFPNNQLVVFLEFACAAIQDFSFLQFFNVSDQPNLIFNCVCALGAIVRLILAHFRIPYVSIESEDATCDLNENCIQILRSFGFMLDVIQKVKAGLLYMELSIYEPLTTLIAGLAKCELVNGWLLIDHLGWKPPIPTKAQIFPPIPHIPLETLQNDRDLLTSYIYKLNFFGIASKIQFEENWMTFLSVINTFAEESHNIQNIAVGLHALSMMLEHSVKVVHTFDMSDLKLANVLKRVSACLSEMEPPICQKYSPALPYSCCVKTFGNKFNVDITSCVRFLVDLFSQWSLNIQGKIPLILVSKIVECIVNISKYFDDTAQYVWMFDTLMEINKGCEKDDDILWTHLIHGIFVAASKFTPESEVITSLSQALETALTSPYAIVANAALETALQYFQNQPESLPLLNVVVPYVLQCTQLSETLNDTETHSYNAWRLLLYIWNHCQSSGAGPSLEQDILGNILTVLSPLNKVHVSIHILVLKSLKTRVEMGGLKPDTKKVITKIALDTLKTHNTAIFYESFKLFITVFYSDFAQFYQVSNPDPEVVIQIVERAEVLFLMLKNNKKIGTKIASRVLPILVADFLPPSEILNRTISQFLSHTNTTPELLAPTITQIFEKARQRPQEAILVREWIIASLPSFIASADVSRSMWNLTVFFLGISATPDVFCLLPFAQLRRNACQMRKLLKYAALDYYSSLTPREQDTFESMIRRGPIASGSSNSFVFLLDHIYSLKLQRTENLSNQN